MILFYQPLMREGATFLDPDESRHCVKVLRRKTGDAIQITDGVGTFYEAVITTDDSRKCEFEVTGQQRTPEKEYHIHIALAPTRNIDRTEWFVEKAVEIGIDMISFMRCAHSERTTIKTERLQKVAVSAMKQSLRATLPEIRGLVPFADLLNTAGEEQRFIAIANLNDPKHLMQLATRGTSYCVLIGPEGDFSPEEIDQARETGFEAAGLGDHRLRTETAALVATQTLNLVNL